MAAHVFSPLDDIVPPLYNGLVYAFPCPNDRRDTVYAVLQQGLSAAAAEEPRLTAHVEREHDASARHRLGSMKLVFRTPGQVVVARTDLDVAPVGAWPHHVTYAWLQQHKCPPSILDPAILAPTAAGTKQTSKLMEAQINFLDGGALLSACFAHAVIDAWGICLLMEAWASKCRLLQGLDAGFSSFAFPGLNFAHSGTALDLRSLGERLERDETTFARLKHRKELWRALCLHESENNEPPQLAPDYLPPCVIPAAAGTSGHGSGLRTILFEFRPQSLISIKEMATSPKEGWVSTADALTAFLWRHVLRARFPQTDYPTDMRTLLSTAINGRQTALRPKIPDSYPGNCIFFALVEHELNSLLDAERTSLSSIAATIRKAITDVRSDESLLQDTVALAASMPDVRCPSIAMKDYLGLHFSVVHWISNPFGSIGFGPIFDGNDTGDKLGRPAFFRLPRAQFGGICGLLPKKDDGTIEVTISLLPEQMDRLLSNTGFTQFGSFLCE